MGADTVQLRVFDWLDAVAAARDPATGKPLPPETLRAAMIIVRSGKGLAGQRVVVPAERIAQRLDVSRRQADRYVKPLRKLGYLHQVREPSPNGPAEYDLTGPATYDMRTRDRVPRSQDTITRDRVSRSDPEQPVTQDTLTPDDVPRSGRNVGHIPGVTQDTVTRDRVSPQQENKYLSPPPITDLARATLGDGRRHDNDDTRQALGELARFAGTPVPGCAGAVEQALTRGWRPDQLVDAVRRAGDLNGSRNVDAVVRVRLEQLGDPPPPRPPKCADCDPNRMVEREDGSVARCPNCHPSRSGGDSTW